MFDSLIYKKIDKNLSEKTLEDFCKHQDIRPYAKIVYGAPGVEHRVYGFVGPQDIILNLSDTEQLASLEQFVDQKILVVTDPVLMRGFDYRCKHGIELLIATSFEHERALD